MTEEPSTHSSFIVVRDSTTGKRAFFVLFTIVACGNPASSSPGSRSVIHRGVSQMRIYLPVPVAGFAGIQFSGVTEFLRIPVVPGLKRRSRSVVAGFVRIQPFRGCGLNSHESSYDQLGTTESSYGINSSAARPRPGSLVWNTTSPPMDRENYE